ncbi:hypothetical protein [Sediminibacterium sp. C3]|uniref:hypothetical protein n=1 Tax=Sediminibacterium sp. C3 TaxID=1267211 RepID=UPI00047E9E1C|nr:hypothetical protein [Sediminibacterium sp. C3]
MTDLMLEASDEISFKDLVLKIQEWFKYLLTKWTLIGFLGLLGGGAGFFYAHYQKPKYNAKITFVLEENKNTSGSLGGLASLAGQFGVDIGATSGGGLLSGDNILLYFKSPSLAREVLMSRYKNDSNESIADQYALVYGLTEKWKKNKKIGIVNFPISELNKPYSRQQDSLLQSIISSINAKQFAVSRVDKKAGFIDVSCSMESEPLAKVYCERIVQRVVERYISIKTQRQNATVEKLQFRVDSIAGLLKQKTVSSASLQNTSSTMDINPLYRTGTSVAVETTLRDKTLLSTIFASVTQNLEMAKFTLSQETPVIQIVDTPILPLKVEKLSRLKSALIGALIFGFIVVIGLVIRRLYASVMA